VKIQNAPASRFRQRDIASRYNESMSPRQGKGTRSYYNKHPWSNTLKARLILLTDEWTRSFQSYTRKDTYEEPLSVSIVAAEKWCYISNSISLVLEYPFRRAWKPYLFFGWL